MVYLLLEDSPTTLAEKEQEAVIQRKIEEMQRFIREDPEQAIQISYITKRHFELQIFNQLKTRLQTVPAICAIPMKHRSPIARTV